MAWSLLHKQTINIHIESYKGLAAKGLWPRGLAASQPRFLLLCSTMRYEKMHLCKAAMPFSLPLH